MRSKAIQERYERIKNEGIVEGNLQRAKKTAEKMLNDGFSTEDIMKYTNLTNEQINIL